MNKKTLNIILLVVLDIVVLFIAGIVSSILVKLNVDRSNVYMFIGLEILFAIPIFMFFKMYNSIWKYASSTELVRVSLVVLILTILNILFSILTRGKYITVSFAIVNSMIILCGIGFTRFSERIFNGFKSKESITSDSERIMVIGAGDAGYSIIKELLDSKKIYNKVPVCIIDDDSNKIGKSIHSVPVVGNRFTIVKNVVNYSIDEIIIAIPTLARKERSEIIKIAKETGVKVNTVPGIYELVNGTVSIKDLRSVEIIDLLGRGEIKVNLDEIMGYIKGKVVLITGGGGSIGSELSRQVASHQPKELIILDIYENNAYDIEQELKRKYKDSLNLKVLIASIRDKGKLEDIFKKYNIDIIFNAAAHKHVPLMEVSPNEAIKNNVFGTLNLATLADKYNVKRFVQISTDKAVNPTNIMGASKRICEMIIQTIGKHSNTCEFVAVRFGNVLGSNGSVIPLFKKQIKEGGPVTVTDKEITRYFMTIPEAVSLVLQAGAYAKGGEIFVLDMGEPVKIYDLALNLIKLSGLVPDKDIEIKITGLRPGEKLYEERLMAEEGLKTTANGLISIAKPIELNEETLFIELEELYNKAYSETDSMKELVKKLVPTYEIKNN